MERIQTKVEGFIRSGIGSFDALALELFAYQFERNAPYQAYCRSLNKTPADIRTVDDIPAVPIHAFKAVELVTFPVGHAAAIFHSSTTTGQAPSRHFLKSLTPYELSLKRSFEHWVLPDQAKLPFLILTPPPGEMPNSSLVWMFDVVRRQWGSSGSDYFVQRGQLDEPRLVRQLKKVVETVQPVALLGTTIAFLAFLDYCDIHQIRFALPPGSRLLDTGGMKATKRETTRVGFVSRVQERLGIPEEACINEYGMAELSSQYYGCGPSTLLHAPEWSRAVVVDPETGSAVRVGQSGLLKHIDLANVDSVMAIQTDDLAEATADGFVLLGRAANAEVRGCSLSAEAFLRYAAPR